MARRDRLVKRFPPASQKLGQAMQSTAGWKRARSDRQGVLRHGLKLPTASLVGVGVDAVGRLTRSSPFAAAGDVRRQSLIHQRHDVPRLVSRGRISRSMKSSTKDGKFLLARCTMALIIVLVLAPHARHQSKSRMASWPSSFLNKFPGWGSAWKMPASRVVLKTPLGDGRQALDFVRRTRRDDAVIHSGRPL